MLSDSFFIEGFKAEFLIFKRLCSCSLLFSQMLQRLNL